MRSAERQIFKPIVVRESRIETKHLEIGRQQSLSTGLPVGEVFFAINLNGLQGNQSPKVVHARRYPKLLVKASFSNKVARF